LIEEQTVKRRFSAAMVFGNKKDDETEQASDLNRSHDVPIDDAISVSKKSELLTDIGLY